MKIIFKPIQKQHLPLAYSFLRDALKISFGDDPLKWPNNLGTLLEKNYIEIIERKLVKDPLTVVHAWLGNEIIGQIESSLKKDDPHSGYVSLYYLIPKNRGFGFGSQLDDFTTERLARLGCQRIQLTVEPSNIQALKFYRKHGWISKGLHPSYEDGILMEKLLSR